MSDNSDENDDVTAGLRAVLSPEPWGETLEIITETTGDQIRVAWHPPADGHGASLSVWLWHRDPDDGTLHPAARRGFRFRHPRETHALATALLKALERGKGGSRQR